MGEGESFERKFEREVRGIRGEEKKKGWERGSVVLFISEEGKELAS